MLNLENLVFLTEMELSKKKTSRYNNYDDISGSNDEVIVACKAFPTILNNDNLFIQLKRITKRFEVRTKTTMVYLALTDAYTKVFKEEIQISLTERQRVM